MWRVLWGPIVHIFILEQVQHFGAKPGDSCSWKQTCRRIGLDLDRALFLDLTDVLSSLLAWAPA